MIKGLYASASGLIAAQEMQDVVSNNLANVDTAGFKKDKVLTESFADMYMTRLDEHGKAFCGRRWSGCKGSLYLY